MNISDTPPFHLFKTTSLPPILPTPLFLWEKYEPLLFLKILKTQTHLPLYREGGGGVETMKQLRNNTSHLK